VKNREACFQKRQEKKEKGLLKLIYFEEKKHVPDPEVSSLSDRAPDRLQLELSNTFF
jgi:hypothetical protein